MKDIQLEPGYADMDIDEVGINGLRYPVTVLDKKRGEQSTIATVSMSVNLPRQFRGTHMSRFLEILHEHRHALDIRHFSNILRTTRERLGSLTARISMRFPYFVEKEAPVSGQAGMMDYDCSYEGFIDNAGREFYTLGAEVPVATVCPCSREISDRGAHNQRGVIRVKVRYQDMVWLEDLIRMVETCASCELYALLKRPDEKFVTEAGYDNPMFVEDVVREVAKRLNENESVTWLRVETENVESIHNHNAFAVIEMDKTNRNQT